MPDRFQNQVDALNNSLIAIGDGIKAVHGKQESINARLLDVEQKLIGANLNGHGAPSSRCLSHNPVSQAFSRTDQLQAFRSGMPTTGRLQINEGLRAALTNTGRGDGGSTNYPTPIERAPGLYGIPTARLTLLDVLPIINVASTVYEYIQLNSMPVAGYQILEGDEKQESTVASVAKRSEIATIAHHTTASVQVLTDNEDLEQQIGMLLSTGCSLRLENELLNGDGGTEYSGKISGLMKEATPVTSLTATDPADRIGEAITGLHADGWEPRLIVLHPLDWFNITRTRENAGSGQYLLGSPRDPSPLMLWGVPVVLSANMPSGQALVLDTNQVAVLDRAMLTLEASRHHGDNFTKNMITLLAELRAGLAVFSSAAVRRLQLEAA